MLVICQTTRGKIYVICHKNWSCPLSILWWQLAFLVVSDNGNTTYFNHSYLHVSVYILTNLVNTHSILPFIVQSYSSKILTSNNTCYFLIRKNYNWYLSCHSLNPSLQSNNTGCHDCLKNKKIQKLKDSLLFYAFP